jgi:hypothetical protein
VVSGKDSFAKMTRKISKYVSHKFNDTGEFWTGMVELQLYPLDEPVALTNINQPKG